MVWVVRRFKSEGSLVYPHTGSVELDAWPLGMIEIKERGNWNGLRDQMVTVLVGNMKAIGLHTRIQKNWKAMEF